MPYGFTRSRNRLSDDEYRYRKVSKNVEYVFVDHGFFDMSHSIRFEYPHIANAFYAIFGQGLYLYFLYQYVTNSYYWPMMIFNWIFQSWNAISTTAGAHRLWSHRSYSAHWTVRLFLAAGYSTTYMSTILDWGRGHRVHHKWQDTDSDPHNARRSFGFAHAWWVYQREHPDVIRVERQVRIDDLKADPIVKFQHDYNLYIIHFLGLIIPYCVLYPWYGTNLLIAISSLFVRNVQHAHIAAFVNSAAHMFGSQPYNSKILASDNMIVSITSGGEGNMC